MNTNKKRALLASASLIVALMLAELITRFAIPAPINMRFEQDIEELRKMNLTAAASIIENDPELFWRLAPERRLPENNGPFFGLISNNQSLREDHEIPLRKAPDEIRILFIGDSRTFGYGVAHDECYVQLTEKSLQDQLPDIKVECINAGVPGYSTFQGWRYLKTRGLDFEPDVIVMDFGWNDNSEWDGLSDMDHYAIIEATTPPALLRHSRLCQLLWKAKVRRQKKSDKRKRLTGEESLSMLKKIKTLADRNNATLLVLFSPMRKEVEADKERSEAPANSIALDLMPVLSQFAREHGLENIYIDDGHVTGLGHAAIAQAIVDKLQIWIDSEGLNLQNAFKP